MRALVRALGALNSTCLDMYVCTVCLGLFLYSKGEVLMDG